MKTLQYTSKNLRRLIRRIQQRDRDAEWARIVRGKTIQCNVVVSSCNTEKIEKNIKCRSLPASSVLVRFTWATNVSTPRSTAHHGLVSLCERAQVFVMPSFAKLASCAPNCSVYVLTWYGGLFSATLWRMSSVTVQKNIQFLWAMLKNWDTNFHNFILSEYIYQPTPQACFSRNQLLCEVSKKFSIISSSISQ